MQCGAHEQNTKDLSALKSSQNTIRWILGLGFPVATVFITLAFTSLTSGIAELKGGIGKLNDNLMASVVSGAEVKVEMRQLRSEMEELKSRSRDTK